jgi:L-alanine-DL-glutamate epimerase-like enolase superfamily enzyme
MARIAEILLYRLSLPLTIPYKVSLHEFHSFDPIVVEMIDEEGRSGWGEAEILAGYGDETPGGGWRYCRSMAERLVGREPADVEPLLAPTIEANSHAASVLVAAAEMLQDDPALALETAAAMPLLTPVSATDPAQVADEIAAKLAAGFRTFKVKVGFEVKDDLERVGVVQRAAAGRALLRLDANQAFTSDEGRQFAAALDPHGIELFEQPCDKDDWSANAAVARVSRVPIMLDESIYGPADIKRAATVPGVGFVKLKLKKLGGLRRLIDALKLIRELGLKPVLGDGTASEIACWMEACAGRHLITGAGEMNGFLKLREGLFLPPLPCIAGEIRLPAGYRPAIDRAALARATVAREHYRAAVTAA